jgi:hypothetical protein
MARSRRMFRRTIPSAAAVLALAALTPIAGSAQRESAPALALSLGDSIRPAPALKAAYRVRLTSTWPQEATAGCRNGGVETIDGTLARAADGRYTGTFTRRTRLLFCGAHGNREGTPTLACELELTGQGTVAVTGALRAREPGVEGQDVLLVWTPIAGHAAAVRGACATAFKAAVKQMYLTTPHTAEFALPSAGTGPRTERLENYAWTVELE